MNSYQDQTWNLQHESEHLAISSSNSLPYSLFEQAILTLIVQDQLSTKAFSGTLFVHKTHWISWLNSYHQQPYTIDSENLWRIELLACIKRSSLDFK